MIQEQCHRLNRYTTNLLNLGRLQAGLDSDRFAPCDALEALGSAIIQARRLGPGHHIIKTFELTEALVRADPVMLEQIFQNILENAVRYSEPGTSITISVTRLGPVVAIAIGDEGRGIAAEDLSRIFDRFYQAGESRFQEGSGLGLAIAKGFTEAFGGTIRVGPASDVASGSIVTVELPLDCAVRERR
jgi:two-component system sensor histidine kinase KdpD